MIRAVVKKIADVPCGCGEFTVCRQGIALHTTAPCFVLFISRIVDEKSAFLFLNFVVSYTFSGDMSRDF